MTCRIYSPDTARGWIEHLVWMWNGRNMYEDDYINLVGSWHRVEVLCIDDVSEDHSPWMWRHHIRSKRWHHSPLPYDASTQEQATLRRIRVTIVAVGKQCYLFSLCLCVCVCVFCRHNHLACKARASCHIAIRGLSGSPHILLHCLMNDTIFGGKKFLNIKCFNLILL